MMEILKKSMFSLKEELNRLPELQKAGITLQHTAVLNAMAKVWGFKNVQALAAFMEDPTSSSCKICPHCGAVGTLSVDNTIFIEAGVFDGKCFEFERDADCLVCSRCKKGFTDCFISKKQVEEPRYELYGYETEHDFSKGDAGYFCDVDNVEDAQKIIDEDARLQKYHALVLRNSRDYSEAEIFVAGPKSSGQ